jgi:sulfite exporter TauE/SafE
MESGLSESGRLHRIHGPDLGGPNFDIQGSLLESDRRKTNWTYVLGQLLAYAGVALLTVGSTLVLWGYFGGPASYAPTGWLTTMAGQMLLILGVVTLVSGGMEQTNEDVRVRIERLGERMIRFEQIARDHALRGPSHVAGYDQAQTADAGSRHDAELRR